MTDAIDTRTMGKIAIETPITFNEDQIAIDPVVKFFHYGHLPNHLKEISKPYAQLAKFIINNTPRNAERSVTLRKLLEAKDCNVRAHL